MAYDQMTADLLRENEALRAECERLRAELEHEEQRVADMMADVNRVGHELDAVYDLLPSHYYMDPPDGGDVPLLEQLRRMAEDAKLWRTHKVMEASNAG